MKIEIDKNAELQAGDIIEMHFAAVGPANWEYFRAVQLAILMNRLEEQHPLYELKNWSNTDEELVLTFKIRPPETQDQLDQVQQAGIGTAAVIAAIVIGGGLFAWLSLKTVYKITDSPAGKIALVGAGSLGIGVLVLVILLAVGKVKG